MRDTPIKAAVSHFAALPRTLASIQLASACPHPCLAGLSQGGEAMKEILVSLVFGAVVVLVTDCGSIRAEESFFSRLNPFRMFQRQTTPDAPPPTPAGSPSYGTPGPAWHSGQQISGDQVSQPRFNGDSASHGGRFDANRGSDVPASARARSKGRGRQGNDTEGRPARIENGRADNWGSMRGGPAHGSADEFDRQGSVGSFRESGADAGFSRAGGPAGSLGPGGRDAGLSLGTGFRGR